MRHKNKCRITKILSGTCLQNIPVFFFPIRLITPWAIVLNEKLLVAQPIKKFPVRTFKAPFT